MALKYQIVIKDGKVKIEMIGCIGPVCDVNAEAIRQKLGLAAPVEVEYKPEYAMAVAEGENVAFADAEA